MNEYEDLELERHKFHESSEESPWDFPIHASIVMKTMWIAKMKKITVCVFLWTDWLLLCVQSFLSFMYATLSQFLTLHTKMERRKQSVVGWVSGYVVAWICSLVGEGGQLGGEVGTLVFAKS